MTKSPQVENAKVGFISVKRHPRECRLARVCVDGTDVTLRCFAADDVHGWADCFKTNEHGQKYLVNGKVATERLTGNVVIDFPRGLD